MCKLTKRGITIKQQKINNNKRVNQQQFKAPPSVSLSPSLTVNVLSQTENGGMLNS